MTKEPSTNNELLSVAIHDCKNDLDEVRYLVIDSMSRLNKFLRDIKKTRKYISLSTYNDKATAAREYIQLCATELQQINASYKIILNSTPTYELVVESTGRILSIREFLRTHQALFGALITSTDWQSPSFDHSLRSQAGRQTNTIYATINDYKRDRHEDAFRYERTFVREYVDNWIKFPVYAYATSSGMAAFTTILNFLLLEKKVKRKVLIGNSTWFENKALITTAFADQIISVNESETPKILNVIKNIKPSVILFDSLANSEGVSVPDLSVIIPAIVKYAKEETYLIIDNTCLTCMLQPLKHVFGKRSPVRLIVFESLNKYHQFGMDRVTAGLIWCYGVGTKLSDYRERLGTNILDSVVMSLPSPNRKLLHRKLLKHSRNASIVASCLQSWINLHPEGPFASISYPGLTNHPSYDWAKDMIFHGSFLAIELKKQYQTIPTYQRFIKSVITIAKKKQIQIVAGTSFGLDTTRVYLTALRSVPTKPFIRVAVGTENRVAIGKIADLFIEVFSRFYP